MPTSVNTLSSHNLKDFRVSAHNINALQRQEIALNTIKKDTSISHIASRNEVVVSLSITCKTLL